MIPLFALFPQSASTTAHQVDILTIALLVATGIVLFSISFFIAYFGIRYHHGSSHSRKVEVGRRANHLIEWGWTYATFFVFIGIFVWAAVIYFDQHLAPAGAIEIQVIGKQWMWKFQHPDGRREINELHVPVGTPVLLTMTSQDVIHSFFVPAFRVKQDVLPERYVHTWFEATKPGTYHLFCTQYCGTMHSEMRGQVITMQPEDYQRWLATGLGSHDFTPAVSRGKQLFTRFGCISCHGGKQEVIPGVRAPNLAGIFGTRVELSNGKTVLADENYLRESILNPGAKITKGYTDIMPRFVKIASEEEILDLIAYIKSLRGTP